MSLAKVDIAELEGVVLSVDGDDDLSLLLSCWDDEELKFLKCGREGGGDLRRSQRGTLASEIGDRSVSGIKGSCYRDAVASEGHFAHGSCS